MPTRFAEAFEQAARVLDQFRQDPTTLRALDQAAQAVHSAFAAGKKVMAAGNGGSMADALHFCEEWTGRFKESRRPYPAMALGEATHLTCVGNDFGFEEVFARLVRAFGQPGDVLFLLSTSGNSENLIRAARAASEAEVTVIGFLGRGGGALRERCDLAVIAPGETSDRIQELHMLALHALIEEVELRLSADGS